MNPETTAAIVGVAIGLGAGLKHLVPQMPNRFIPAATFLVTALGCLWASDWDMGFSNVLAALTAALGPTGLHQLAKTALPDSVKVNGQSI